MEWSKELNELGNQIRDWRRSKGFVTPGDLNSVEQRDAMLGKLMLVVTEVSEAAEAVRHNDMENFKEELADTIIRLLDISRTVGINIEMAVHKKMDVNAGRPIRHGKETSL